MPSTDVDGSPILILSVEETKQVQQLLYGHKHNKVEESIAAKVKDVLDFEARRQDMLISEALYDAEQEPEASEDDESCGS